MEGIYLKGLEVIKDVNPLKAGLKIEFTQPICFLVGDNAVGKSTVMECLSDYYGFKDDTYLKRGNMKDYIKVDDTGKFPVKSLDFHSGDRKFSSSFGDDISLQMFQMKASSGQCSLAMLQSAGFKTFKEGLVLLDEPCRGLSIKNQWGLANIILQLSLQKKCQLLVVTHSETILNALKTKAQFYSVSEGRETTFKDFMITQLTT